MANRNKRQKKKAEILSIQENGNKKKQENEIWPKVPKKTANKTTIFGTNSRKLKSKTVFFILPLFLKLGETL